MRVLVAPDCFGSTLTALEAATAIGAGWRTGDPAAEVDLAPLSDGGPGFVEVMARATGSRTLAVPTTDPLARPVTGWVAIDGTTAYVESAHACGLHLLAPQERDPERTSSAGVADLLAGAADAGAQRIVVGLGGSATNDGGEGLVARLDELGATSRVAAVELVAATDVDNPLLGLTGASAVYGPQKGADREAVARLEGRMQRWADDWEARTTAGLRDVPGAGAAGGLGFALMGLGARRESGLALVLEATRLRERVGGARLVVTGEGRLDATSLRGKVTGGVAALAAEAGVPCVVLAGQVAVGRREAAAHGIEEAHAVSELAGGVAASMADPARWLTELAATVARMWGRT